MDPLSIIQEATVISRQVSVGEPGIYFTCFASNLIIRLHFSHIIAFTATRLQPCLIAPYILSYAQCVLVEGFQLLEFEQRFLQGFPSISRHTNIIHIFQNDGKPTTFHYVWTHSSVRPWGHHLPIQCKNCGSIRPWVAKNGHDSSCLFSCNGCSNKIRFSPPETIKWLGAETGDGRWMVIIEK